MRWVTRKVLLEILPPGGALPGLVFDITGGYTWAIVLSAVFSLIGAAAIVVLEPTKRPLIPEWPETEAEPEARHFNAWQEIRALVDLAEKGALTKRQRARLHQISAPTPRHADDEAIKAYYVLWDLLTELENLTPADLAELRW